MKNTLCLIVNIYLSSAMGMGTLRETDIEVHTANLEQIRAG